MAEAHAGSGDKIEQRAPDDYCYLTTRGRVTGRAHEIEIWFALAPVAEAADRSEEADVRTLYLLAGGGTDSDWVRNLQAEPAVTVRLGEITYAGTARVLERGTDEDERARTLVFEKFQPRSGGLEGWRESSLAVAIDLARDAAGD